MATANKAISRWGFAGNPAIVASRLRPEVLRPRLSLGCAEYRFPMLTQNPLSETSQTGGFLNKINNL